jgi:hypothetical protein
MLSGFYGELVDVSLEFVAFVEMASFGGVVAAGDEIFEFRFSEGGEDTGGDSSAAPKIGSGGVEEESDADFVIGEVVIDDARSIGGGKIRQRLMFFFASSRY